MPKLYYSVLTSYGSQAFARAMASRQPLNIVTFAVGDGNGRAVQPDSQRTSLVREVYRANVSAISLDPRNARQVIFELTIPENVGGFWIREMGIFDNQNRLVAYANCPDSFKPQLESGSGKVQVLRMILLVSSSDAVTLTVDDTVIFAKRGELTPQTITDTSQNSVDQTGHSHAIDHASTSRKGVVQLTNDTGLDSESLALTAKGAKKLSQEIAQNRINTTNLANQKVDKSVISDSVSSNSQTTVASSRAIKTSYDKGVEAKTAADNANNNANGRVSKAGDTMTGHLTIQHGEPRVHGKRGNEMGWYVGFPNANDRDVLWHNYLYNTNVRLKSDKVESNKELYVGSNKVHHTGDSYARLSASDIGNAGIDIVRTGSAGNWASRIEALSDKRWKFWVQGSHEIFLPAKGGTVALTADVVAKGGDTMTGILEMDTPNAIVRGRRNGAMGWYVGFPSASGNDLYLNSYIHNTRLVLQTDRVYSNRDLYVEGNKVHHAGDSYARLSARDSGYAGLDIVRSGNAGNFASRIEALPNKQWKFWVQNSHEILLPAKGGTVALTDDVVAKGGDTMTGHLVIKASNWSSVFLKNDANKSFIAQVQPDNSNSFGKFIYLNTNGNHDYVLDLPKKRGVLAIDSEVVNKAGDTMTGHLTIQHGEPRVHGKRGNEMGWYVGFPNANDRDVLWHNYLYNTNVRLKSDKVESNKELYVGSNKVHHTGDSYAEVSATNGNYAGLNIVRSGNAGSWASRIEAMPDKRWKFWVERSHEIYFPVKSGTVMLEGDFATKARSLVNRRDYNRTVSWGGNNVRMAGSVTVYPDGRIEQIIHVKAFRMIWLGREAAGTGGYGGERGFQIPVQLWTAMPSKITKVHAQTIRATEGGSHTYYSEAGEWNVAWQLFGNTNERNWVNLSTLRVAGGVDEPIDLYLVVEGY